MVQEFTVHLSAVLWVFAPVLAAGTMAGFYYFLVPIYMYLKNLVWPKSGPLAKHF
jgi:hypothetical protein